MGGPTGAVTSWQDASRKRGRSQLYHSGKVSQEIPTLLRNRCVGSGAGSEKKSYY